MWQTPASGITNLSISEASNADPGVIPPSAFETVSTPFGSNSLESDLGWSRVAWRDDDCVTRGGGDDDPPWRPDPLMRRLDDPLPWLAAAGLRVPRSLSDCDDLRCSVLLQLLAAVVVRWGYPTPCTPNAWSSRSWLWVRLTLEHLRAPIRHSG